MTLMYIFKSHILETGVGSCIYEKELSSIGYDLWGMGRSSEKNMLGFSKFYSNNVQ